MKNEKRVVDILDDNTKYKLMCDMMYFHNKGKVLLGAEIKKSIPFDISPNQPLERFFKECG